MRLLSLVLFSLFVLGCATKQPSKDQTVMAAGDTQDLSWISDTRNVSTALQSFAPEWQQFLIKEKVRPGFSSALESAQKAYSAAFDEIASLIHTGGPCSPKDTDVQWVERAKKKLGGMRV